MYTHLKLIIEKMKITPNVVTPILIPNQIKSAKYKYNLNKVITLII